MAQNPNVGGPPEAGLPFPRIIVHGGMYTSMNNDVTEYMRVLKIAAKEGYAILQRNGTAVDAVEKAVLVLEDNDNFNAGHGSFFNERGVVECDAMIMDGHTLEAGGVAAVRDVPHPVKLSKKILSASKHCILSGQGAFQFALKNGIEVATVRGRNYLKQGQQSNLNSEESMDCLPDAGEMDTVSAIAMDCNGYLACATSSGGMPGKAQGRVGDVPLIGCGGYANERGAATTSGHGELIIKMTLAREVVYNIEKQQQDAQTAVDNAIREVESRLRQRKIKHPYIGVIAMDSQGNFGTAAHESELLPWARISSNLMQYGQKPGCVEGEEAILTTNNDM